MSRIVRSTLIGAAMLVALALGPVDPTQAGGGSSVLTGNRILPPLAAALNVEGITPGVLCRVVNRTGVSIAPGLRRAPRGDAFYTPPRVLPGCTHGAPIYRQRLDNPTAALQAGENWLVMYRSEDVHGNPIATSGIIALPKRRPPRGGYPVISWAHGTVGVADSCAPRATSRSPGPMP